MKIRFTTVNRNNYVLEVNPTDTVQIIKRKLSAKYGFDRFQMLLFYRKKCLDNDQRSINTYNVHHYANVQVGFEFYLARNL